MSRIGKQQIALPANTTATIADGVFSVKGPLGQLSRSFKSDIVISINDNVVTLAPVKDVQEIHALWGTYASHIANMVAGVNTLYQKKLLIDGVGFRVELKGKQLVMQLGFSHPVIMDIPEGLNVLVEKNVVTITGIDKELVGQFAARLRDQKKPEPYKGKGFRYDDETIRRKEGKRAA
ncbi:MAG: 50S ribosomal protein L6 [Candidatus Pacebacteria bacterium]|nr:50S ribosomal protein L6 [Candidatus Paceibacterota bacterium]